MRYVWSHHALERRLRRSSLTTAEIEHLLDQRRYVIRRKYYGKNNDCHLVWDAGKGCLIGVPLVFRDQDTALIPTLLSTEDGNRFEEWMRAEAERAWLGEQCWQDPYETTSKVLDRVTVTVLQRWVKSSGYQGYDEVLPILSWAVFDPKIAQNGDEGVVALFREKAFCHTVRNLLQEWAKGTHISPGDTPAVFIKKRGANRTIPFSFFLSTP